MLRLTWTQPEDLVPHGLARARADGADASGIARRWAGAGGSLDAPVNGSTPDRAPDALRALARELLAELDALPLAPGIAAAEPDDLAAILGLAPPVPALPPVGSDLDDRLLGGWLGRAAGCLLGKPVEKLPREGIRAIAQSTGNWPISGYFTEVGLDHAVAAAYPWNRRSRSTSLAENIDGMPEDDDLNFALMALRMLEADPGGPTTDRVAQAWLSDLPGGRVFTAERIVYRNLLDGIEPEDAAVVGNPFVDWIGAQIRTDVYGWARPGDPRAAVALAHPDAMLTHRRDGLYGALFAAGASAAAVVGAGLDEMLDAGLSVVPSGSRYAAAIARGRELGASDLEDEAALDALHAEFGDLHWVHARNNSALLAFALVRSRGEFARAIALAVAGGWDTDSVGATAGALTGAMAGASGLSAAWIDPLRGRLATSIPGEDGVRFADLARRTREVSR